MERKDLKYVQGYDVLTNAQMLAFRADEVDFVIDDYEDRIKKLEAENNRLRYERLIKSSILYRNHANEYNWEQLLLHNKIKNMSPGEFIIRMVMIADSYEARAKKILEQK